MLDDLTIPKQFRYIAEIHFEHTEMINSCHYILLIKMYKTYFNYIKRFWT
jgi:hypothetical protein